MEVLTTREVFLHVDFTGSEHCNGYGSGCDDGSGYGSGYGYSYGDGYGYSYGDGKGKTNGSGYGSSSGYGSGSGYGYGNGFGSGSGYSNGDGNGSGYGKGFGYGYGSGSGYGDGFGLKSINGQTIDYIDDIPTILTHIIGNVASGFIVHSDFSLIPTFIYKYGNMFAHGETLHKAREAMLEKLFDDMPTEERIEAFCAKFKPGVKRPAMDFFLWHHRLTGSCEQGRREFAQQHNIDIDSDEMTPEEFFALTRNSYGSSIIQQTEKVFACQYKAELAD